MLGIAQKVLNSSELIIINYLLLCIDHDLSVHSTKGSWHIYTCHFCLYIFCINFCCQLLRCTNNVFHAPVRSKTSLTTLRIRFIMWPYSLVTSDSFRSVFEISMIDLKFAPIDKVSLLYRVQSYPGLCLGNSRNRSEYRRHSQLVKITICF